MTNQTTLNKGGQPSNSLGAPLHTALEEAFKGVFKTLTEAQARADAVNEVFSRFDIVTAKAIAIPSRDVPKKRRKGISGYSVTTIATMEEVNPENLI